MSWGKESDMTQPIMTQEYLHDRTTPICPHCSGQMYDVTVWLESIVMNWPLPKRIAVEDDGYAYEGQQDVIVECPDCGKPSALAIDADRVKLVACRTAKDMELVDGEGEHSANKNFLGYRFHL